MTIEKNEYLVVGPIPNQPLKWQVIVAKPPRHALKDSNAKRKTPEPFSRAEVVAQFKDEELAAQFCETWNGDTNQEKGGR